MDRSETPTQVKVDLDYFDSVDAFLLAVDVMRQINAGEHNQNIEGSLVESGLRPDSAEWIVNIIRSEMSKD